MAVGGSTPPMLNLRRSAQSGNKAMAAGWTVIYTESSSQPYLFIGASLNLSVQALGDTIDVRIRTRENPTAAWTNYDQISYVNARPAAHQYCSIGPIPNVSGVEISARQTAGVLRTVSCEFYDARRLGFA